MKSPEFLPAGLPQVAVLIALLFTGATVATAQTETVLYSFQKNGSDGILPSSGLIASQSGALYGTTQEGGSGPCNSGCGTIYELTPPAILGNPWTEEIIYSFQGEYTDGEFPSGNLALDNGGALYGAAGGGAYGYGVIYKLTPPPAPGGAWTETVLYSFPSTRRSGEPNGSLVFDKFFSLYGTTFLGGAYGLGAVFKLTPQASGIWTLTILYSFQGGADAQIPMNGLTFDSAGALYGTTSSGGQHGAGAVFKLTPPAAKGASWTETVLYSFEGPSDGDYHTGSLILDTAGSLYGATNIAGPGFGAIFKLSPPASSGNPWAYTVLYNFVRGSDGCLPAGGTIFGGNGALYGTAAECGDSGFGTVFKLVPPSRQGEFWGEHVLHSFPGGSDGAEPTSPLTLFNDSLYGTTYLGGTGNCTAYPANGCGTVFQVTP